MNPTPENLTLAEIMAKFSTEEDARAYLEAVRWPEGPVCPHCGNCGKDRFYRVEANKTKKIREGLLQCAECRKQFTVTFGTIFEDSHIPLRFWLVTWYLMCASKKGVAATQVQRMFGLGSYKSAWTMMHRIRKVLAHPVYDGTKLGGQGGTVEADETYMGGKK